MLLSKCALCNSIKRSFIKEPEASGLSSRLAIETPLNEIPLLGDIFLKM